MHEQRVRERITKDLANHTVTVLHASGLYRHWRCQQPGTWSMGFDIVTWPGSLCYTGDMGEYLFQRTEDMVAFMHQSCMSYNYAAEKCVAHDGRLKEWSEKAFKAALHERSKEGDEITVVRRGERVTESVSENIEEILREYGNYSSRHDAEKAMYKSGLWDGGDIPNCEEYTFHFLWALHAIKWFCGKAK